jgi:hypothetical protein
MPGLVMGGWSMLSKLNPRAQPISLGPGRDEPDPTLVAAQMHPSWVDLQ